MCCFAQPIDRVGSTRIFGRLSGTGTQFLAYQMEYESKTPNAMILPLPTKLPVAQDAMRFISLESYGKMFNDFQKGFPRKALPTFPLVNTRAMSAIAAEQLEVHEVGDYITSFVPNASDFDRLDEQFVIPNSTWDLIPDYRDYSFAVFQLTKLKSTPHPMAFEFPTRDTEQVYFPTVHIHDGEVHDYEEFDHILYTQNPALDDVAGDYRDGNFADPATKLVRSNRIANNFVKTELTAGMVDPNLLLHRKLIVGNFPNVDQRIAITPAALGPKASEKSSMRLLPWALPAAAFAWFINRRSRIRKNSEAESH